VWQKLCSGCNPAFPYLERVLAPDAVVALLGGRFAPYTTFAALPPEMKIAPAATSAAATHLWFWWSVKFSNHNNKSSSISNRPPTAWRRAVVKAVLLTAVRVERDSELVVAGDNHDTATDDGAPGGNDGGTADDNVGTDNAGKDEDISAKKPRLHVPHLPNELWMHILGFLKHDAPPPSLTV
jgi:hypothetical protein